MIVEAALQKKAIVIRLPLNHLKKVVEAAWASNATDVRMKVTDVASFAEAFVEELNLEAEDGTTLIDIMFDKAVLQAFEAGAEGIEEHPDQEGP